MFRLMYNSENMIKPQKIWKIENLNLNHSDLLNNFFFQIFDTRREKERQREREREELFQTEIKTFL